jgi:hypothetical protein
MESVQTYLPLIKALLSEWYLFTLNNPLYAAVLAITVWLLTAIFYSIRIAAIKRSKVANEKAAAKNFDDMQQQLQLIQEELASTAEQMENAQSVAEDESQRAQALEQLIYQRNQHIAGTIQTLATSFDLGERPQIASEDVKSDSLWQQHDKVILQLVERLRTEQQAKTELQQTCQTATVQLAEKESLLNTLQSTLANHTNLLAKLEQALDEQKSMLLQQNSSQQALSDTLKNFQAAPVVAPSPVETKVEPKPEPSSVTAVRQQPAPVASPAPEAPQAAQPAPAAEPAPAIQPAPAEQPSRFIQPAPVAQTEQITQQPQATVTRPIEQAPIETPVASVRAIEAEIPSETVRAIEEEEELLDWVLDENLQPVLRTKPPVASDTQKQATAPAKGSIGKIKTLFGKKPQPVKTEPQWTDEKADKAQPSSTVQQSDDAKAPGKLKGFYSKFTSKEK